MTGDGELDHSGWMEARHLADQETGYDKAWGQFSRASTRTMRIGKKIFKIAPATIDGLLVRIRVIETHDEIFSHEPEEMLLLEIRALAKRLSGETT